MKKKSSDHGGECQREAQLANTRNKQQSYKDSERDVNE